MFLLAEVLLAGVLLIGVLPLEVLLVAEEEEFAVSGLLEKKEMILLGSEILEEERALLFFDALLVIWYFWHLFSSADWTGGQRHLCFWSLPMHQYADTAMKICEYKCNGCKNEIGIDEEV